MDNGTAFYPTLPSILRKYARCARRDGFDGGTAEEFEKWRGRAVETLSGLLGMDRMERCSPEAEVTERTVLPGMVREHLLLRSEPEVTVSAYILIPEGAGKDTPVFICPPGHHGCGKESVAGSDRFPGVKEKAEKYHSDYGMQLARLGYVAYCPDCRGAGERREDVRALTDPVLSLESDCRLLAHMGAAVGISVAGMMVWDLMRGIDYLCERNEWNTSRLLGCGFSGGGMQILYLSALDARLYGALISGYFYGFGDSLVRLNGNCCCNYVPGLMTHFDMGDLAAMGCPRKKVVQAGRADPLSGYRGIDNVLEQVSIAERAYAACGRAESLVTDVHDGGHVFCPDRLAELAAFLAF